MELCSDRIVVTPLGTTSAYVLFSDANLPAGNGLLQQLVSRYGEKAKVTTADEDVVIDDFEQRLDEVLTSGKVAKYLQCSQRIVNLVIDSGGIKGYRLGVGPGHRRVTVRAMLDYIIENNMTIPMKYKFLAQRYIATTATAAATAGSNASGVDLKS